MNCSYCKGVGSVEKETTTFSAYDIPDPFIVESVPAFVCRLCGDKSFSAATVTALQAIKEAGVPANGSMVVKVLDYRLIFDSSDQEQDPRRQV